MLTFTAPSGSNVLVGQNERENDHLTFNLASTKDTWLHACGFSGAHVVLRGSDEDDILYASSLAAKYSKAPKNERANIHVCNVIYIGKPSGARNGMVTIDQSFTKTVAVYNPP